LNFNHEIACLNTYVENHFDLLLAELLVESVEHRGSVAPVVSFTRCGIMNSVFLVLVSLLDGVLDCVGPVFLVQAK
jgi:hypothetical protein